METTVATAVVDFLRFLMTIFLIFSVVFFVGNPIDAIGKLSFNWEEQRRILDTKKQDLNQIAKTEICQKTKCQMVSIKRKPVGDMPPSARGSFPRYLAEYSIQTHRTPMNFQRCSSAQTYSRLFCSTNSVTWSKASTRFSASYSSAKRTSLNGPTSKRKVCIPSFLAPQKSV